MQAWARDHRRAPTATLARGRGRSCGVSVIIKRAGPRKDRAGGRWLAVTLAVCGLSAGVAVLGTAWRAGGPQPVHEISVPVAVPAGVAQ